MSACANKNPQQSEQHRVIRQGMLLVAAAFSGLLQRPIHPQVDFPGEENEPGIPGSEGPQLGVTMTISGAVQGDFLLTFSEAKAADICKQLLTPAAVAALLDEPARSTLQEVGNILASAFLVSLDEQLGLRALPSPPGLTRAPVDVLLQRAAAQRPDGERWIICRLLDDATAAEPVAVIYLSLPSTALATL